MVLTRWDPLFEIRRSTRLARRRRTGLNDAFAQHGWSIPLDIVRDGDMVTVTANIPGVDSENIDVTIEGEVLSIKADIKAEEQWEASDYLVRERRTGSFSRLLRLSENVDTENVETRYESGVLTITLPMLESKKAKHFKVA